MEWIIYLLIKHDRGLREFFFRLGCVGLVGAAILTIIIVVKILLYGVA